MTVVVFVTVEVQLHYITVLYLLMCQLRVAPVSRGATLLAITYSLQCIIRDIKKNFATQIIKNHLQKHQGKHALKPF